MLLEDAIIEKYLNEMLSPKEAKRYGDLFLKKDKTSEEEKEFSDLKNKDEVSKTKQDNNQSSKDLQNKIEVFKNKYLNKRKATNILSNLDKETKGDIFSYLKNKNKEFSYFKDDDKFVSEKTRKKEKIKNDISSIYSNTIKEIKKNSPEKYNKFLELKKENNKRDISEFLKSNMSEGEKENLSTLFKNLNNLGIVLKDKQSIKDSDRVSYRTTGESEKNFQERLERQKKSKQEKEETKQEKKNNHFAENKYYNRVMPFLGLYDKLKKKNNEEIVTYIGKLLQTSRKTDKAKNPINSYLQSIYKEIEKQKKNEKEDIVIEQSLTFIKDNLKQKFNTELPDNRQWNTISYINDNGKKTPFDFEGSKLKTFLQRTPESINYSVKNLLNTILGIKKTINILSDDIEYMYDKSEEITDSNFKQIADELIKRKQGLYNEFAKMNELFKGETSENIVKQIEAIATIGNLNKNEKITEEKFEEIKKLFPQKPAKDKSGRDYLGIIQDIVRSELTIENYIKLIKRKDEILDLINKASFKLFPDKEKIIKNRSNLTKKANTYSKSEYGLKDIYFYNPKTKEDLISSIKSFTGVAEEYINELMDNIETIKKIIVHLFNREETEEIDDFIDYLNNIVTKIKSAPKQKKENQEKTLNDWLRTAKTKEEIAKVFLDMNKGRKITKEKLQEMIFNFSEKAAQIKNIFSKEEFSKYNSIKLKEKKEITPEEKEFMNNIGEKIEEFQDKISELIYKKLGMITKNKEVQYKKIKANESFKEKILNLIRE